MKNKILKTVFVTFACLALLWCGIFLTDFYRSGHLQRPLFAVPSEASAGTGISTYKGLGYTVEVVNGTDPDGPQIVQVTMSVSGKAVSASIS